MVSIYLQGLSLGLAYVAPIVVSWDISLGLFILKYRSGKIHMIMNNRSIPILDPQMNFTAPVFQNKKSQRNIPGNNDWRYIGKPQ